MSGQVALPFDLGVGSERVPWEESFGRLPVRSAGRESWRIVRWDEVTRSVVCANGCSVYVGSLGTVEVLR